VLLTLVVAELPEGALDPPAEDPLDPAEVVPLATDVSEPEPEVAAGEEPVDVVDETVDPSDPAPSVLTEPETVALVEAELPVVTVDVSTVAVDGLVATGAGAFDPDVVIGDEPSPLELLTSVGAPLEESASRRPFGADAETTSGVLASVASD
jgi:hypothetical protein